jgi:hypothetical protein
MRRFNFGGEDEDEEDNEEEMASPHQMFPEDFITMTQFGNADNDLISTAVKICEKSWVWKFRGVKSKISMISEVFTALKDMTSIDIEE